MDTSVVGASQLDSQPSRPTEAYLLDHLAIAVPDLEEGIRWYCDNLGFSLLDRRTTYGDQTSMSSAVVKLGSAIIVLIQGHEPESQVSRFLTEFGPGVQHIALCVPNIEAAMAHFPGGTMSAATPIIEGDGIRQIFLERTEGSGVRVELVERNGGTFNDDSVRELFHHFERRNLF